MNGVAPSLPSSLNEKVTIWDAISDLAFLESGEGDEVQEYRYAPQSEYEKNYVDMLTFCIIIRQQNTLHFH